MGRIILSDNISIDGVFQDPAGDEGWDRGGWVGAIKDRAELGQLALDDALAADVLLMGRRTYEWFAGRWPSRTGPLADRLNGMPKHVVSSTLDAPAWANTTVVHGDVVREVTELRQRIGREILVTASSRLVKALLEYDLVDEVRLKVFPVILGDGDRLFGGLSALTTMRLVDARSIDGDTAFLTYVRKD